METQNMDKIKTVWFKHILYKFGLNCKHDSINKWDKSRRSITLLLINLENELIP